MDLAQLIERDSFFPVDTGMFPNEAYGGATLQLRFCMISPEEAAESGELVNLAVAVGALSGDAHAQAMQQSGAFPLVEITAEKALEMQQRAIEQAVTWCRGFSIDGGKTWLSGGPVSYTHLTLPTKCWV